MTQSFQAIVILLIIFSYIREHAVNGWWTAKMMKSFQPTSSEHEKSKAVVPCVARRLETVRNGKWRKIINVVIILDKRWLPFQGSSQIISDVHNGNFVQFIELPANYEPILREHVTKRWRLESFCFFTKRIHWSLCQVTFVVESWKRYPTDSLVFVPGHVCSRVLEEIPNGFIGLCAWSRL